MIISTILYLLIPLLLIVIDSSSHIEFRKESITLILNILFTLFLVISNIDHLNFISTLISLLRSVLLVPFFEEEINQLESVMISDIEGGILLMDDFSEIRWI